jgi:hypothetical protein
VLDVVGREGHEPRFEAAGGQRDAGVVEVKDRGLGAGEFSPQHAGDRRRGVAPELVGAPARDASQLAGPARRGQPLGPHDANRVGQRGGDIIRLDRVVARGRGMARGDQHHVELARERVDQPVARMRAPLSTG